MLKILHDPVGATGRDCHDWDTSLTIFENVVRHLPDGGGDCEVLFNGVRIDPVADERMNRPPTADDFVTVLRRPAGFDPVTWAYIAIAALAIATIALMPRLKNPAIPKAISNIILRAMAPDVTARYQRAADLLEDVLAVSTGPRARHAAAGVSDDAARSARPRDRDDTRGRTREAPAAKFCWQCRKPLHARSDRCPFCGEAQ